MRRIIFAALAAAVCFIGCKSQNDRYIDSDIEHVTYTESNSDILNGKVISKIEIVPLQTNREALLGNILQLQTMNGEFFIADFEDATRIFRFDKTGTLLNTIGQRGRGPQEYIGLSDFSLDGNEKLSIFSDLNEAVYEYSTSGEFIEKTDLGKRFLRGVAQKDKFLTYWGFASINGDWRLASTNKNGKVTHKYLEGKYNVLMMDEKVLPVFYKHNEDTIYLRESINPHNIIYQVAGDKIHGKYSFDFGKYNVPPEYFEKESPMEAAEYLFSRDFVVIRKFMENSSFALVESQIQKNAKQGTQELVLVYGIKNKLSGTWNWFDIKEENHIIANAPQCLTTDNKLICLVEASKIEKLKDRSIISNPEIIDDIKSGMNSVVLICSLK